MVVFFSLLISLSRYVHSSLSERERISQREREKNEYVISANKTPGEASPQVNRPLLRKVNRPLLRRVNRPLLRPLNPRSLLPLTANRESAREKERGISLKSTVHFYANRVCVWVCVWVWVWVWVWVCERETDKHKQRQIVTDTRANQFYTNTPGEAYR